jgi:cytochrome bd-type quinol oxidase subunit 1
VSALLSVGWNPEVRGILTVIIGVVTLCGSVYLLLGTNIGARLGFLVSLAGLFGWMALMGFSGWVATLAGWYVTEIGLQPFMVYGQLRIAELASTTPSAHIAITLAAYVTVYLALIVAYVHVLRHLAKKPIDELLHGTGEPNACTKEVLA